MDLQATDLGYTLTLSKAEADTLSDTLLKRASECNKHTLDFAYLTAEAVLSLQNTFRQPKSFTEVVHAL